MAADAGVALMAAAAATALATPFAWPASGLDPLPWFPFTVAVSRGDAAIGERLAQRTERAYWQLRKMLGVAPRFRLLVLNRADWPRYAGGDNYGIAQATADGHLVVGTEPADGWDDVARCLALHLPPATLRKLVQVHGPDRREATAPDLTLVADALLAHELAHVVALQAGARFPRRWLAEAFANYALVAVLAETEPAALHRLGTLAEAARDLAAQTPGADTLDDGRLDPARSVLVHLALTRAAFVAYAEAGSAPLQRWLAAACAPAAREPDADHELGRYLARIHPALAALAPERIGGTLAAARAA